MVRSSQESSGLSAEALQARLGKVAKGDPADMVCCSYVYVDRQKNDDGSQNIAVEDMNSKQLSHFLLRRSKEHNGILQRFVRSKSVRHSVIRVMWTPRTFHAESRTNHHRLDDTRVPMEDRVSTFGGGPHLSDLLDLKVLRSAPLALVLQVVGVDVGVDVVGVDGRAGLAGEWPATRAQDAGRSVACTHRGADAQEL